MDALHAENVLSWVMQVTLIASIGALLGATLRIRHARARLVYCYGVMIAAIFLPALQPVQDALVITRGSHAATAIPASESGLSWMDMVLIMVGAGAVVRFGWFGAGFVQLRQLRRRSSPLERIPDALYRARRVVGVDAVFRLSDSIRSPAALGHIDPIILFPPSFAALSDSAQHTIAVHELLHVRRSDWLRTVIEQCLTGVFWFNPGMWWLVAESRLCREEIVDADVIALTAERLPYVAALLAFANTKASLRPLPTAQFFSKRQLSQRMQALVRPPQEQSIGSVALTYSAMIVVVLIAAVFSFVVFPVQGRPVVLATRAALLSPPIPLFQPLMGTHVDVVAERIAPLAAETLWNATLPAPARPPGQDVVFLVHRLHVDAPVMPSEGIVAPRAFAAIRAIRPGDVISPGEIGRLLADIPRGQTIEITQDGNHIVTRVVMGRAAIRRASDEIDVFTLDLPVDAIHDDDAAAPAEPTDGVD